MASKDTFFLRTNLVSTGTSYVSDDIDISAFVDPARGKIMIIDRGFITVDTDGNGPVQAADVVSSGTGGRSVGIQCCSEKQTTLQQLCPLFPSSPAKRHGPLPSLSSSKSS